MLTDAWGWRDAPPYADVPTLLSYRGRDRTPRPDAGQIAVLVWRCDACGAPQAAYQDICLSCGHEIDYRRGPTHAEPPSVAG